MSIDTDTQKVQVGKQDPRYTSSIRISKNLLKDINTNLILKITSSGPETVGVLRKLSDIDILERQFKRKTITRIDSIRIFKIEIPVKKRGGNEYTRLLNFIPIGDLPGEVIDNE